MSADPKPCPFCGGVGVTVKQGDTYRWRLAQCDHCGAQAGDVRIDTLNADREQAEQDARAAAIAEWNQRAA